jgi:hypothetical protein
MIRWSLPGAGGKAEGVLDVPRRPARLSAALDETTRTVVAERVRRAGSVISRLMGLAGHDGLAADEALWISPCRVIHTIGVKFPIDAVFLDEDLRVVALREDVIPWRAIRPARGSASVLELPAGTVRRVGLAVGNQMDFVLSGGWEEDEEAS